MTRTEIIKQGGLALLPLMMPLPFVSLNAFISMTEDKSFDVIVIGGSYAGLSAAMALGRSMRKVMIIDNGLPCNRQTPHSHNFITQDGEEPHAIAEKAKKQVLNYQTVSFHKGKAIAGNKVENGFIIRTEKNETFSARKLIFATGIKDIMPDIKGFSECWGISVIHCPYCHGYEFRQRKTGIMANGERAFHLASLVRNLTESVTVLTSGKSDFTNEQQVKLSRNNIAVIETEIIEIQQEAGQVQAIIFKDGKKINLDAVYAFVPFIQSSDIPTALGCKLTEQGYIQVDSFQKTTVEGIFACGDNASMMRSVSNAVAAGSLTGAMVNKELVDGEF